jgi:hypothetical protein
VDTFVAAYVKFVNLLLIRYPDAKVVLLQGPMNNSEALGAALFRIIGQLSGKYANRVHFLELSPQGSAGHGADYHPNRAQSEISAIELTAFLSDLMDWR